MAQPGYQASDLVGSLSLNIGPSMYQASLQNGCIVFAFRSGAANRTELASIHWLVINVALATMISCLMVMALFFQQLSCPS